MDHAPRKRLKRIENAGTARFLNFSCYKNRPLLDDDGFKQLVLDALAATRQSHDYDLWAFVIMPTHVHLLIWPRTPVAELLKSLKQSVARRAVRFAKMQDSNLLEQMVDPKGIHRFWQRGGGFDRNLWNPKATWQAIDYIHDNPVQAGLCSSPKNWEWSSAAYFIDRSQSPVELNLRSLPPRAQRY